MVHHIAVDHWSLKVALRDLDRLYRWLDGEGTSPPLRVDDAFLDFRSAQDDALASAALSGRNG